MISRSSSLQCSYSHSHSYRYSYSYSVYHLYTVPFICSLSSFILYVSATSHNTQCSGSRVLLAVPQSVCMSIAVPVRTHLLHGSKVFSVARNMYVNPLKDVTYTGHSYMSATRLRYPTEEGSHVGCTVTALMYITGMAGSSSFSRPSTRYPTVHGMIYTVLLNAAEGLIRMEIAVCQLNRCIDDEHGHEYALMLMRSAPAVGVPVTISASPASSPVGHLAPSMKRPCMKAPSVG